MVEVVGGVDGAGWSSGQLEAEKFELAALRDLAAEGATAGALKNETGFGGEILLAGRTVCEGGHGVNLQRRSGGNRAGHDDLEGEPQGVGVHAWRSAARAESMGARQP